MKAKISKIGPVGDVVKSKEFYIPLLKKNIIQLIKLKDGTTLRGEPMMQTRHLLEIGDYKYWVRRDGEIIMIDQPFC